MYRFGIKTKPFSSGVGMPARPPPRFSRHPGIQLCLPPVNTHAGQRQTRRPGNAGATAPIPAGGSPAALPAGTRAPVTAGASRGIAFAHRAQNTLCI